MSAPVAPISPSTLSMPARKPSAGLPGVDGVLVVTSSPVSSSKATTSVKVPPVSMPMRMRRVMQPPNQIGVTTPGPAVRCGVSDLACFGDYLAAWNEPDPHRVRALLERSVTDGVVFADPANRTEGREALLALILEAREALPTATYRQTSGIDGGHDHRYRYQWEVVIDGAVAVVGMDCTTIDADGRIERLDGFFGAFPEAPQG